jgi:carbon-monoxide dehydrogenase large subunit
VCGFGPYESATVRVEPNGTVTVFTGTSPHGQGLYTTFAQIVADQLGAEFDHGGEIGDTANTPMGQGTMGSRSLAIGGGALGRDHEIVREKAVKIAAHMLEAALPTSSLTSGRYHVKGAPDPSLTLAQIAKRACCRQVAGRGDIRARGDGIFPPHRADLSLWRTSRRWWKPPPDG